MSSGGALPSKVEQGSLELPQAIALHVGAALGTGVLLLPSLAYRRAAPASLIAWAALILLSVSLAATFAALAPRHPNAGGVSHFVRIAFGGRAAAVTGWWFYFGVMAAAPSAALIGGLYIADLLGRGYTTAVVAAVVMLVVTFTMNALGVRPSARLQLVASGLLAVVMVLANRCLRAPLQRRQPRALSPDFSRP
ncbi:amino acid permease [Blastococcus sp. CCUG 61487]|uniref:amino acid permease n=1 Tax=Blastococcus sp. CCUG 61487 TaxID=1840703 RepID=UPI0014854C0E|nr:amino acid permease [Blastococcus sp. CCUG 61487]